MGVDRLGSVRNEEGLARYISQYEKFKNQQSENLTFPSGMEGLFITLWENNCDNIFLRSKVYEQTKVCANIIFNFNFWQNSEGIHIIYYDYNYYI